MEYTVLNKELWLCEDSAIGVLSLGDLMSSWQRCSPSVRKDNINNLETVLKHNMANKTEYTQTNPYSCRILYALGHALSSYLHSRIISYTFCLKFPPFLDCDSITFSKHVIIHDFPLENYKFNQIVLLYIWNVPSLHSLNSILMEQTDY